MVADNKRRFSRSSRQIRFEGFFRGMLVAIGVVVILLVASIFFSLIIGSVPSIEALGLKYLWGSVWDPVRNIYGALPFALGTLLTSFLALAISVPFSFSIAIFLGEYFPKGSLSNLLKNVVELIAAIPSVIYGFWGIFVLVPLVRQFETVLGVKAYGSGIFTSAVILAIMIIPYAASMGRELIRMVPSNLKEAAYSLGATRYEVIRSVVLPYTKSGMFAAVLLSLGRALGETMAVTMVIGNTTNIPGSIFDLGNTMASVIANEFAEATTTVYYSALIELGLVLFLVTVVINLIGRRIINRVAS
jgi:phosphate transport system permease protein